MTIRVHLFARARDLAGASTLEVELPEDATVSDLRRGIAAQIPVMKTLLESSAIAVNHDFASQDRKLDSLDEVAIIPPVSGG